MIFIDTNVLLDIATRDPVWASWSLARIEQASSSNQLKIDSVVYAELSVRYDRSEFVEDFLDELAVDIALTPKAGLFLAGKIFAKYRAAGGTRTGVLPDFFIGAHAEIMGAKLLTRDRRRYETYFPTVTLIAP